MRRCVPVEDMFHEPSGFLSGTFRGAQQRWATIEQGEFRDHEYLLLHGLRIHTDHRNLMVYIFNSGACVSSVMKTTTRLLDRWKAVLGQYDYNIEQIEGERACFGVTRCQGGSMFCL